MQECPDAHHSCSEFRAACCGASGRRVLGARIAARQRRPARPDADCPADADRRAAGGRRRLVLAHTKVPSSDQFEGRAPGGKGEELTVGYLDRSVQEDRPEARQHRRHATSRRCRSSASRRRPRRSCSGRASTSARSRGKTMSWRGPSTVADTRVHRRLRAGLRRLRRRRAGVQLGRLQGPRRQGQDARDAGQRPAGARSVECRRSSIRRCSAAGR